MLYAVRRVKRERGRKHLLADQRQHLVFVALILKFVCICRAALARRFSAGHSSPRGEVRVSHFPIKQAPYPPLLCALHSPTLHPLRRHYSMLSICGFQTKQANKQNNRKTHHADKLGPALEGEMERDLVCFPGQFHFSAMAEKASQDTETLTCCLTSRGRIKVVLWRRGRVTQYTAGYSHLPLPKPATAAGQCSLRL